MSCSDIVRKYLWQSALLAVLVGLLGGAYYLCCPQHYFSGYPLIPVYFFLFGLVAVHAFETVRCRSPKLLLQLYMVVRVLRMLLAATILIVYCAAVKVENVAFAVTFVIDYLIFLTYDSYFFYRYESGRKKKKSNEENETKA